MVAVSRKTSHFFCRTRRQKIFTAILPYGYQVPGVSGVPCGASVSFITHGTPCRRAQDRGVSSALIDIGADPFDTAELIRIASARNAAAACGRVRCLRGPVRGAAQCGQRSARRTRRGSKPRMNDSVATEVLRVLSLISLNTANEFLHTFRFRDYSSLIRWLRSETP